jgi:hypothetical protein
MNPSIVAADPNATPTQPSAEPVEAAPPEQRPEPTPDIVAQTKEWFVKTDNLVQRKNALFEYRESQKALFPARFNPNDPRRGQTPQELMSGKDQRRVQTPYIYRGTLQITAMSVPEDLDFEWSAKPQVQPPQDPMLGMPPTQQTDPMNRTFGETLRIVQKELLDEAGWIEKLRAWVQDGCTFPLGILKQTFRREYQTGSLNPNPGDKDATDGAARLKTLIEQFAAKEFTENDAPFAEMKSLIASLKDKARITRWWGTELQLIPLDAFGISEECTDMVNWYDAPYMFHDALITGEQLLTDYRYRVGEDGETFGILPDELNKAVPWDTNNTSTDPNARNRASRNKQLTAPNATPIGATNAVGSTGIEPKKRLYAVREIWSKRDRTVYVVVRGLDHFLDKFVPQKTPEQWYPFHLLAPNRVATEIYQASDVELKRQIQQRIHRKRSDEEKARWLHLPRGIYNRAAGTDEKEMVKLQDVQPGQLRGINFGTTQQKIDDMVQWFTYQFDPMSFDTSKDEQDMDAMGALPVQALGSTGSANFATEVSVASAGAQVATAYRKSIIQQAIERLLTANAEVLLQELSLDEVQRIAGPFAVWPILFDEVQAAQAVDDAKTRAAQMVAPQIVQQAVMQFQTTGALPDEQAMAHMVEQAAGPVWQAEMQATYGAIEPPTRETLFRRLKVKVRSSFNSKLDKQQNLQMFSMLAEACMQIGQAAAGMGQPFVMKAIVKQHAALLGDEAVVDEAFPAVSPMMIAQQLAKAMVAQQQKPGEGGKGPETQTGQGGEGASVDPAGQANNALASAPAPMG